MKGAVAALAGATLFFLGVLTGASGDPTGPPPPAIALGAQPASSQAGRGTPAPDQPATPAESAPTPAGGEPTDPAGDPAPAEGSPAPDDSDASSVPPAGEEPPAPGGSGGVEEVGGRVDCVAVDGGQVDGGQDAVAPNDAGPSDGGTSDGGTSDGRPRDSDCPSGQDKKAADPPKDKKGDGDGRQ